MINLFPSFLKTIDMNQWSKKLTGALQIEQENGLPLPYIYVYYCN